MENLYIVVLEGGKEIEVWASSEDNLWERLGEMGVKIAEIVAILDAQYELVG